MVRKLIMALLAPVVLYGCGDDISIPSKYEGKASTYINEDYDIYDKNGLMAMNVKAYANGKLTVDQRVATVIELAKKNQEVTKARMVFASLYDESMRNAGEIATAHLYVAKCGLDEKSCDDIQWKISYATNEPSSMDRKVYNAWWGNRNNFKDKNGSIDEDALKKAISENLNIPTSSVSLFNYESWINKSNY